MIKTFSLLADDGHSRSKDLSPKKNCVICGGPFQARGVKKTCSAKCARQNAYIANRKLRPPKLIICVICGYKFHNRPLKNRSKTCTDTCHVMLVKQIHDKARTKFAKSHRTYNLLRGQNYREKNRLQIRSLGRNYAANCRRHITDNYIATSCIHLPLKIIPPALIAAKREHVKLKRLLKEQKYGENK